MVTGDRGAKIVDLETVRTARLCRSLEAALEHGYVIIETPTVTDVPAWRRAARKAAAANGWRVRTGVTGDGSRVWAVRLDQETTEQDRAVLRDRLGYLSALLAGQ